MPVESKVIAATAGAAIGTALLNAALPVLRRRGPEVAAELVGSGMPTLQTLVPQMLAKLPPPARMLAGMALPSLLAFTAGWVAKHSPRGVLRG